MLAALTLVANALAAQPAWWGFLGAILYAGPRLTPCIFNPEHPHSLWVCLFEFLLALMIGAVGAAAFTPWLLASLHHEGVPELRAISTLVGLSANQPKVLDLLGGRLVRLFIKGGS